MPPSAHETLIEPARPDPKATTVTDGVVAPGRDTAWQMRFRALVTAPERAR